MSLNNTKAFEHKIPEIGDKVILLDGFYETLSDGKEAAKLARLPHVTITGGLKILLTDDAGENPYYSYEIYINESKYCVGLYGSSWKYLKNKV